MRILLADDQPEVCSALRLLLEQESGLEVVGEAAEIEELLAQIEATRPDLVLLDWELPGLNASSSLSALRSCCSRLVVVALSGRPEARRAALDAGADAFVSKGYPPERLLETLQTVGASG
jgi:DNA-binding NarL/FixJ family response regulator